jgi:hypothetical protein
LGCTCSNSPQGMICVPKCNTTADCPTGGPNTLTCNEDTGICVPQGAPGGM